MGLGLLGGGEDPRFPQFPEAFMQGRFPGLDPLAESSCIVKGIDGDAVERGRVGG